MYYEFKMVDPALRKVHTETNQGEIFKVFEEENIFQFKALAECRVLPVKAKYLACFNSKQDGYKDLLK